MTGDILAAIDAATGCQYCEGVLGSSPSGDFCSEECQYAWHSWHVEPMFPPEPPSLIIWEVTASEFAEFRWPAREAAVSVVAVYTEAFCQAVVESAYNFR